MTRRMRCFRRLRSERGAAMVEFAIVLPILLLLVFGIMDFGLALWRLNNLTAGVREAARFAAARQTVTTGQIDSVVAAWAAPTNVQVMPGATPSIAAGTLFFACTPACNNTAVNPVQVQVGVTAAYQYDFLTPLPALVGMGTQVLMTPAVATFRWEWGP